MLRISMDEKNRRQIRSYKICIPARLWIDMLLNIAKYKIAQKFGT